MSSEGVDEPGIVDLERLLQHHRDARRAADERYREAMDALARIGHELRSPLTAISGFTELLARSTSLDTVQQLSRRVLDAARHLDALVEDVFRYAAAGSSRQPLVLADVDLHELVDEAAALAHPTIDAQAVVLRLDVADELRVHADRRAVVQVLVNLLSNAAKYGGRGTTVRVEAGRAGPTVRCSVTDEGPGLSLEDQVRVFRAFERLERSSDQPGIGLGLPIANALVARMGGRMSVASEPGHGATFWFELPARSPSERPAPGTVAPASRARDLVLCVEDDPLNVALIRDLVALVPGRSLHVATTVADGVAAAIELRPAVVLLDLQLPDGTGLDVLAALRAEPSLAGMPVFVLTADVTSETARAALAAGADRYVTKPFDLDTFVELVASVTEAEPGSPAT